MIRINLLAVERDRTKRPATFDAGRKIAAASGLMILAAAAFVAWWYWSLGQASVALDQRIADAEREAARLRSIIEQVQQFEQQRGQLQQRVALIEQLRKGQSGPVHLLDEVSRALPDTMWLIELKQEGVDVTIDGRCTSLTALSEFVGKLEGSEFFDTVEIVNSQV